MELWEAVFRHTIWTPFQAGHTTRPHVAILGGTANEAAVLLFELRCTAYCIAWERSPYVDLHPPRRGARRRPPPAPDVGALPVDCSAGQSERWRERHVLADVRMALDRRAPLAKVAVQPKENLRGVAASTTYELEKRDTGHATRGVCGASASLKCH
jgi:hypothetical protein